MIGVIDIRHSAEAPAIPPRPIRSFTGSPSTVMLAGMPGSIGNWCITKARVTVTTPDSAEKTYECVRAAGFWVVTIDGCTTAGTVRNGWSVYADGIDENGTAVTGYRVCTGDVEIVTAPAEIVPETLQPKTIAGYDATKTQILENDCGTLKWVDATTTSGSLQKVELEETDGASSSSGSSGSDSSGSSDSSDSSYSSGSSADSSSY